MLVVGGSGRGGYERKVRAGCRRLELCPGQAEAPSAVGEIDTKEAERHGNLFNFCQSRREEDNSQTGSKLECGGVEKPCACWCVRVRVCVSVCVYKTVLWNDTAWNHELD